MPDLKPLGHILIIPAIHFAGVPVLFGAGAGVLLFAVPPLLRRTPAQPRALLEVHTGQSEILGRCVQRY